MVTSEQNLLFYSLTTNEHEQILPLHHVIVGHNDEIFDVKVIDQPQPQLLSLGMATNSPYIKLLQIIPPSTSQEPQEAIATAQLLVGHSDLVLALDALRSSSLPLLVSASKDMTVKIWNTLTRQYVVIHASHAIVGVWEPVSAIQILSVRLHSLRREKMILLSRCLQ